jgi:hypothetical protein
MPDIHKRNPPGNRQANSLGSTLVNNKKTTIAGYLLVGAGALTVVAAFLGVGDPSAAIAGLMAALGGAGLIGAQDGGH